MLYKAQSTQIKDLDEGVVTAYANYYNNEDSDGDISMPGSFKRTVDHQAKKIRVFKDHDRYTVLGVPIEMDANDPNGLLTRTKFNMEKEVSRDMFTDIKLMMEHGQDADLSVGVIPVKRDDQDRRKVTEWKLKEYSFLSSWGANEMATVQMIKSGKPLEEIISLITKAYDMDYSDSRLVEIETILKSLEPASQHFDPTDELKLINIFEEKLCLK
jgi:HK97 family phage prohead protease